MLDFTDIVTIKMSAKKTQTKLKNWSPDPDLTADELKEMNAIVVDRIITARVGLLLRHPFFGGGDRLGRLALGADEQDAPATGGDFAQGDKRLMQQGHALGQVENMDVVALPIDEGRHLRVPALLAVAEMGARLEQLAHGKFWQSH